MLEQLQPGNVWMLLPDKAETITTMGIIPLLLKTQEQGGKEGNKQLDKLRAAAPSSFPALSWS